MKRNLLNGAAVALLSASLLALTSCSSTPAGESAGGVAYQEGVPGGIMVQTHKLTATVTAVDPASRKVTLVAPDGTKTTFKAGPHVANFEQIQVGDQVKATVAEQIVAFLRKNGEPANDGEAAAVALAPVGDKPGILMANTVEITAKVKSIDVKHQKATLVFPDGATKTFKVRKDVDLTRRQVGEEVVIRTTEALAISVEKP